LEPVFDVQVRNSVRPMHLFGHTRDHDYYFELPREGAAGSLIEPKTARPTSSSQVYVNLAPAGCANITGSPP
jgi:hypothetical protein